MLDLTSVKAGLLMRFSEGHMAVPVVLESDGASARHILLGGLSHSVLWGHTCFAGGHYSPHQVLEDTASDMVREQWL